MKTWRIALILLLVMLVLIVPVYAQEATPAVEPTGEVTAEVAASEAEPPETTPVAGVAEETEGDTPNGASLLVLLVGLAAVAVVGFGSLIRQNPSPPQE